VAISVALAFLFGYALTLVPLWRAGLPVRTALSLALAADTLSITLMEIVDNAIMLLVPGAMDAPLTSPLFWVTLLVALGIAGLAAFPLNRWLILRGQGHAVVHAYHGGPGAAATPPATTAASPAASTPVGHRHHEPPPPHRH
jgi:hypothetical protein